MQRTLHEHIIYLEQRIQDLRDQLTNPPLKTDECDRIKSDMRDAELALAHYRKAFELEQGIA